MSRPGAVVILLAIVPVFAAETDVRELVRRSVENNERNWEAAPEYSFTERDVVMNGGKTTRRTYRVRMIEGSQYNQLLEENGEPLQGERAAAEKRKAEQETARRRSESSSARAHRVAQYQRERSQDRALMNEMPKAFQFKLVGHESVNGHECYVLDATPRVDYHPTNRDTKVLTGMRGRMWIDSKEYQWVKVQDLLAERCVSADHTTIWRWVQCYAPELNQGFYSFAELPSKCLPCDLFLSAYMTGISDPRPSTKRRKPVDRIPSSTRRGCKAYVAERGATFQKEWKRQQVNPGSGHSNCLGRSLLCQPGSSSIGECIDYSCPGGGDFGQGRRRSPLPPA